MLKTACSAKEDSDDDGEMNALPAKKSRRKEAPGSCFFKGIGILGLYPDLIFISWYQSRERIPKRRKKNANRRGKRYSYVKIREFMQMAAAEGEKICSNLEKDAKRLSEEGLVRYRVTEETVTAEVGCSSQS